MKKTIISVILLMTVFAFSGCNQTAKTAARANSENAVDKAINEQIENADSNEEFEASLDTSREASEKNTASSSGIDYDLTSMNSDMVYSTVYQMMVNPKDYVGKTVKMSGTFYPYTNADESAYYPACVIEDALACCAQGMEFVVAGAEYPDDYPKAGTVITVVGTFETYTEGDSLYCHLKDAEMTAE